MRIIKRYIPVFLLCMIIWFVVENPNEVENFFNEAENQLSKQFSEITSSGYFINENELAGLEDSGITGSDYTFDTEYYPYYGFLSVEEQLLYKQIFANMEQLQTTFVTVINVTKEETYRAMEAVYNDHPELFWINTSYSYKYMENDIVVQITLDYNDTVNNIEAAKAKFNSVTDKIIKEANTYSTDYEKEKYVHDELLKLIRYNTEASMNQSAYSALVNGETVCAGYARAFQYIMIELGIPTYYVSGYSNQDHAWNIVKLENGYYNVDLTWDDSSNNPYQFFNLTDSEIKNSHVRSSLSSELPSCNATKYKYKKEVEVTPDITIPNTDTNTTTDIDTYINQNDTILEIPEENIIEEEEMIPPIHPEEDYEQYHSNRHHNMVQEKNY